MKKRSFLLIFICGYTNIIFSQTILPSEISNLALWLKADAGVVMDASNKVSAWIDQSTNSYTVTQTTTTKQPLYTITTIGTIVNKPVIKFDGTDDWLSGGDILDIGTDDFTIFVLGQKKGNTGTYISKASSGTNSAIYYIMYSGGVLYYGYDKKYTDNTRTANDIELILGFSDRAKQEIKTFVNGIEIKKKSISTLITDNLSNNYRLLFGAMGSNNDNNEISFLNGYIYEILIYRKTLTDSERMQVEDYFQEKYKYLGATIDLGADINTDKLCKTELDASSSFSSYNWSTGETTQKIEAKTSGTYSVTAIKQAADYLYRTYDAIRVIRPNIKNSKDTAICVNKNFIYDTQLANPSNYTFNWQDGSSSPIYTITSAGNYYFTITDNLSCQYTSTITAVTVDDFENTASLGADKSICKGTKVELATDKSQITKYLWNDASTGAFLVVNSPGEYHITVENNNKCVARDTINLTISGQAPNVDFQYDKLCFKDITKFTDKSTTADGTNIVEWNWKFDGVDTSVEQNPKYTFSTNTTYTITLTAKTDAGCSDYKTKSLIIHPLPVAKFIAYNLCNGKNIKIIEQSTITNNEKINKWIWTLDDGTKIEEQTPKNISFSNIGAQNLKLKIITENNCIDSISKNIDIKPTPKADFISSPSCEGQSVYFFDKTKNTVEAVDCLYKWEFGNGATSIEKNPYYKYTTKNTYNVKLTATDPTNGCTDTIKKPIIIHSNPTANFNNSPICVSKNLTIKEISTSTDGAISKWEWRADKYYYSGKEPKFSFTQAKTINVQLIAETEHNCKDTIEKDIILKAGAVADFNIKQIYGIPGDIINFENKSTNQTSQLWKFGDDAKSTLLNPTHTYKDEKTYQVWLIVENNIDNCKDSISNNFNVYSPLFDIAVNNVKIISTADNYLNLQAEITNYGTELYQFELEVEMNKGQIFKELVNYNLKSGQTYIYNLNTKSTINPYKPVEYVCIKANIPNRQDKNEENNKYCFANDYDFKLIQTYPNPVQSDVNIEFITKYKDKTEITLFNEIGKKIKTLTFDNIQKGLNKFTISTIDLSKGVYFYTIKQKNNQDKSKFIKM